MSPTRSEACMNPPKFVWVDLDNDGEAVFASNTKPAGTNRPWRAVKYVLAEPAKRPRKRR